MMQLPQKVLRSNDMAETGTGSGFCRKQKEIDARMQEVQKQASEGSLFGMAEERRR